MLASIIKYNENIPDEDILIFLSNKEVAELETNILIGEMFEYKDIRKIYSLELSVCDISHGNVRIQKEPEQEKPQIIDNVISQESSEKAVLSFNNGTK